MWRPSAFAAYVFYELRIIDRLIRWKRNHGRKRQSVEVQVELDSHLRLAQESRQVSHCCTHLALSPNSFCSRPREHYLKRIAASGAPHLLHCCGSILGVFAESVLLRCESNRCIGLQKQKHRMLPLRPALPGQCVCSHIRVFVRAPR